MRVQRWLILRKQDHMKNTCTLLQLDFVSVSAANEMLVIRKLTQVTSRVAAFVAFLVTI